MVNSSRTLAIIAAAASLIAIAIVILPPIAQAPLYHAFADARTLYGVPNFWNVISNISFFLVAIYGSRPCARRTLLSSAGSAPHTAYCSLAPQGSALAPLTTISIRATRACFGTASR